MNTIKAVFGGGRFAKTAPMFEWDYGDRLQFVGIQLPPNYEVHFANSYSGTSVTALGDENGVEIPASVFQPGTEIYAWIFLTETGAGWTKYQVTIPVYKRAQPTNETPTPQQQSALDSAIALLNEAAEDLSEAEQGIPTAIDTALQEAKDSGEFDGRDGTAIWYTYRMFRSYVPGDEPYYQYTARVAYLSGSEELTPAIGDYVFGPETGNGEPETPDALFVIESFVSETLVRLTYICNIKGETGPAGADGADGADGYSPTVTVEEITGGHRVTITDADGDHVFDVLDGTGGGGGAVDSVNGKTGAVVLDASDVGALPDDTTYVSSVNGSSGAVTVSVPSASSATPKALGTASAGSSADFSRADHVHDKPSYSKSDVGLGNVDNVQQYSANNPPPYPVTSVNGSTGAVSLTIPSTAGDVGAIPAPDSPSADDVLTYSGSAWAASAPHYVPAGGNAGAVLAKSSASDYEVYWRTVSDYTPSGIITTAAATAAKVCQYSFWDDTHYPQILYVTLASANTAASALTMKVNGKGPYPVYINGAASSATNYTLPAGAYAVYFDGTNFYFQTDGKIPAAATDPQEVTVSTAGAVSQSLDAGKIYHFTGALTSLTITLNAAGPGQLAQYHFDFDSGSTAPTVTLPGTVTMQGGTFAPEASKHYEIDILSDYGVYVAW